MRPIPLAACIGYVSFHCSCVYLGLECLMVQGLGVLEEPRKLPVVRQLEAEPGFALWTPSQEPRHQCSTANVHVAYELWTQARNVASSIQCCEHCHTLCIIL